MTIQSTTRRKAFRWIPNLGLMVTVQFTSKTGFCALLAFLVILGTLSGQAQSAHPYRVKIKFASGGPAVGGFLYAVNDTAVVILPSSWRSPRGFVAAAENANPVPIPTKLIKKLKVSRARSVAYDVGLTVVLLAGYTIVCLPFAYADSTYLGFLLVVPAALITKDVIQNKTFRPADAGFTTMIQKYCLENSDLMVDR